MDEKEKESHRRIRARLILMGVMGAILAYGCPYFGDMVRETSIWGAALWSTLLDIAGHVGDAVVVAAVLGLTIEISLRQRLVKDAFQASIGYLLPPVLRNEMRWLYSQSVICVHHVQTITFEKQDDGFVLVRTVMTRKFKNFSDRQQTARVILGIDEWYRGNRQSRIVEFGYDENGSRVNRTPNQSDLTKNAAPGWSIKPIERKIDSGCEASTWFTIEEIHEVNGWQVAMLRQATKDPMVIVHAPDDIGVHVNFGARGRDEATQQGTQTFQLDGVLLPFQAIYVRWWDRNAEARWRASPDTATPGENKCQPHASTPSASP